MNNEDIIKKIREIIICKSCHGWGEISGSDCSIEIIECSACGGTGHRLNGYDNKKLKDIINSLKDLTD